MIFYCFFGRDIVLVDSIFPTVAVVPAGDAFLPELMGSFHLKSVLFMALLLKVQGPFILNWRQRPHIKCY